MVIIKNLFVDEIETIDIDINEVDNAVLYFINSLYESGRIKNPSYIAIKGIKCKEMSFLEGEKPYEEFHTSKRLDAVHDGSMNFKKIAGLIRGKEFDSTVLVTVEDNGDYVVNTIQITTNITCVLVRFGHKKNLEDTFGALGVERKPYRKRRLN